MSVRRRIVSDLYDFVKNESESAASSITGVGGAGHAFEDRVLNCISSLKPLFNLKIYGCRYSLSEFPTLSGIKHQFDVVFEDQNTVYLIECKYQREISVEQMYAFCGKHEDYRWGREYSKFQVPELIGMFVTPSSNVPENLLQFGIAFGVLPIVAELPPAQKMLNSITPDDALWPHLEYLEEKLPGKRLTAEKEAEELLSRWHFLYKRWLKSGD